MARKKPKPKAFRQVQKEVNDLIKYQFQDLDFWPKMIKKRARALKGIFNEGFGGVVDAGTKAKLQKIRDDLNAIATNSQEIHKLMGEIIQGEGSTEERKDLLSSWQDESWRVALDPKPMKIIFDECEHAGDLDNYLEQIRWAGGRVLRSKIKSGRCVVEIQVKDRKEFLDKFEKTPVYDFSDIGLWG